MIQRIQSVYLLLVAILLVVALCLPVGQFIGSGWDSGSCIQAVGRDFGRWKLPVYMGFVRHSAVECDYCVMHHIPVP